MRRGKRKKLTPFIEHEFQAQQVGKNKAKHPGQSRTPVPGDQAPVRLRQGEVPRLGEEHRADHDAVSVVQLVDGVSAMDWLGQTSICALQTILKRFGQPL
jgi:hypothetical protein